MSILFLDDLIFIDTEEEHLINNKICLFFLLLNLINIIVCSLHIYIYHQEPLKRDLQNSLTFILVIINLFSGISFFLFFWNLYYKNPTNLTMTLKIVTMINPLIIFLFYFWCACLTHNIYASFYNPTIDPNKRIIEYKYKVIIYLFTFFIITMLSIKFTEKKISSKSFSFMKNYRTIYIILFYLAGLFVLGYIIWNIYYIRVKKLQSLTLSRKSIESFKKIINSIVFIYILFIIYFLIIFVPANILIILKYISNSLNFENFYSEFIIMIFISLYGIFIFCVKLLSDPVTMNYFLSIILRNKSYIKDYELNYGNCNDIFSNNITENLTAKIPNQLDKLTYGNKDINEEEFKKSTSFDLKNKIEMKIIEEEEESIDKKIEKVKKVPSKHRRTLEEKRIKEIKESRRNSMFNTNTNNDLTDDDERIIEKKSLANVLESFIQDDNIKNEDKNPFKSYININIKRDPSSNYFSLFSYNLERYNMLYRMIAINLVLNDSRKYDNENKYHNFYFSPLPWRYTNPDYYKEQTPFTTYNNKNIPDWIKTIESIDENILKNIEFKVLSYSPFVFHHLRLLDKLSIDDILKSLDPSQTLQMINESKEILKRGDSSMLLSWDKKLIIKTITKNEKNTFINVMLEEYHSRMRDTKSILSHIYGVFKMQIGHRENYVILQRNMNDLFLKSNVLTFELNGLKVDRQNIKTEDVNLKKSVLFNKYKNIILKDVDLDITGIKFELNPYDGKNILLSICNDSIFLQKYNVIDYSLLIFVNKYSKKNFESHFGNSSVMHDVDKKYIFNFSIVDFLDTFSFEKKSEKFVNDFVGVFKVSIDKNFNLLDPQSYGVEFRKFAKKIIIYEKEDNDNDNFSS